MKIIKKIIIGVVALLMSSNSFAENNLLLVFDKIEKENELPRNFRDLTPLGINAIASGQFSEKHLQEIKKKYPDEKIIIVDLRRESHGFVNGEAVSWRGQYDSSNLGKSVEGVIVDEKNRLSLKKGQKLIVNKILEKDRKNGWYSSVEPRLLEVDGASTEQEMAWKNGFSYKRFVVQDHSKPDEKQLEAYVNFINNLPKNTKVYVHCAAGRGRTTTFLAIYDIMKNAEKLSFDEIIKRQHKIGGVKLDKIDKEEEVYKDRAKERLQMLQNFYSEQKCQCSN